MNLLYRKLSIEPKYCAVTLERLALLGLTPTRVTESGTNGKQKRGR